MGAVAAQKIEVPDIGDFDAVPVIEILVSVGDTVAAEDPLVTLESEKATMDVPAPIAGTVTAIEVSVGDEVSQGSALMSIAAGEADDGEANTGETDTGEADTGETDDGEVVRGESRPVSAAPPTGNGGDPLAGGGPIYASPSVRRLARELGVELRGFTGSGRKGRLTPEDVHAIAEGRRTPAAGGEAAAPSRGDGARAKRPAGGSGVGLDLLPWPTVDFERFGPIERVPRSRIQRISAPNLARNWVMIPHVTHNDEADITDLEAWRRELNDEYRGEVKFTMVAFLVKACVIALKAFPDVNASLDGDELVRKRYWNIGFAADTPNGLVVPVIRDADRKGLAGIANDLTELSGRAREGKLSRDEMSGATFTISSLGGIGGTSFTPIINAPEVAILGVTRATMKPVWNGSEFVPRSIVPLSFSYDHRVIDGALAARFTAFLAGVLSDLRRALL